MMRVWHAQVWCFVGLLILIPVGCNGHLVPVQRDRSEMPDAEQVDRLVKRWPVLHPWDSSEPFGRMVDGVAYELLVARNPSTSDISQRSWLFAGDVVCKGLVDGMEAPTDLGALTEQKPYAIGAMGGAGLSGEMKSVRKMSVGDVLALCCVLDQNGVVVGHKIVDCEDIDGADVQFIVLATRKRLFAVCMSSHVGMYGVKHRFGAVVCLVSREARDQWSVIGSEDAVHGRLLAAPGCDRIGEALEAAGLDAVTALQVWASAAGVSIDKGDSAIGSIVSGCGGVAHILCGCDTWTVWRLVSGGLLWRSGTGSWAIGFEDSLFHQDYIAARSLDQPR